MKLQHTLGGLQGLGPVDFQKKVFVENWETRIFGIHTAMMALSTHLENSLPDYTMSEVPSTFNDIWTWADLRRGAESISPFAYFQFRYYEKWLGGITGFFLEKGYISEDELSDFINKYLREGNMEELPLPTRKEEGIDNQIIIKKNEFFVVPTGIIIEVPTGYEAQVRPRSGLAAKNGISVLNTPGTIDSDYRGEIKVILFNYGNKDFIINNSDRIAQMILMPVAKMELEETESLPETIRGDGGFGSTGK